MCINYMLSKCVAFNFGFIFGVWVYILIFINLIMLSNTYIFKKRCIYGICNILKFLKNLNLTRF